MKKLLWIVILGFLFSGNANAGINEPGTGFLGNVKELLNGNTKNSRKYI